MPQKKFLEWFDPKTTERISFQKSCTKNQLKLIIPKKYWFRSQKGQNIWTLLKLSKEHVPILYHLPFLYHFGWTFSPSYIWASQKIFLRESDTLKKQNISILGTSGKHPSFLIYTVTSPSNMNWPPSRKGGGGSHNVRRDFKAPVYWFLLHLSTVKSSARAYLIQLERLSPFIHTKCTKHAVAHWFELQHRANFYSTSGGYGEYIFQVSLCSRKNLCARTDTFFFPISEVNEGTISIMLIAKEVECSAVVECIGRVQ